MKRSRSAVLLPVLLGALALGGCESSTTANHARLTLKLTDAPGDLAEAHVQIRSIYMQGSSGEGDARGRVVLYEGDETFDLLTLTGGRTVDLVQDLVVPAGTYSQLRLVVGDATIRTRDGDTYSTTDGTLHCPSCSSSGLKVKLPGGRVTLDNGSNIVLLDFDVSQSFGRQAGRSGRWVMSPVIIATDFEASGAIRGEVALQDVSLPISCGGRTMGQDSVLAAFVPQATSGEITVSGITQPNGAYVIGAAAPGSYTLGYAAQVTYDNGDRLSFTAAPSTPSVEVGSGGAASADYTITAASCTAAGG
jgi:hypothetical protein